MKTKIITSFWENGIKMYEIPLRQMNNAPNPANEIEKQLFQYLGLVSWWNQDGGIDCKVPFKRLQHGAKIEFYYK